MGKIIAFTGTHGVGKTTAVYDAAAALKRAYPGKTIDIVRETARDCPFGALSSLRPEISIESQRWIFSAQLCRELESTSKNDLSIGDRTGVDAIAYTLVGGFPGLAQGMFEMVATHMSIYDRIYFLPVDKARLRVVDDGFRDTNLGMRLKIERVLLDLYRKLGCNLLPWDGPEAFRDSLPQESGKLVRQRGGISPCR